MTLGEQVVGWDGTPTGRSGVLRHAPAAPVDGEWVAFQASRPPYWRWTTWP